MMFDQQKHNKTEDRSNWVKTPEQARKEFELPLIPFKSQENDSLMDLICETLFSRQISDEFQRLAINEESAIQERSGSIHSASFETIEETFIEESAPIEEVTNSHVVPVLDEATMHEQEGVISGGGDYSNVTIQLKKKFTDLESKNEAFLIQYSDGSVYLYTSDKTFADVTTFENQKTDEGSLKFKGLMYDPQGGGDGLNVGPNNKEMGIQTIFGDLRFIENVGLDEIYKDLDLAEWKADDDIEEFINQIVEHFGQYATLVLIPPCFAIIESNPLYKMTHMFEAYNIPKNISVENTYNMKFYLRWCNYSSTLLLTRSAEDAQRILRDTIQYKARSMEDASSLATLTAYSFIPGFCTGFVPQPNLQLRALNYN